MSPPPLFAIERRIGRETACVRSRRRRARRRVGATLAVEARLSAIEHLVNSPIGFLLSPASSAAGVALGRAEENLPEAETDLAGEIRDHAAHVVGDDLHASAARRKSRNRSNGSTQGRGLVRPSPKLNQISFSDALPRWHSRGKIRARAWGAPTRAKSMRGHASEDRPETRGRAQRLAGDVGEDLDAGARPSVLTARSIFGERGLDIVHWQRGDEGRKTIGDGGGRAPQASSLAIRAEPPASCPAAAISLEWRIARRNDPAAGPFEFVERGEPRLDNPTAP